MLVTVTYPPAVAETSLGVDAAQRPTDWIITHQGRRLMVYSMAPEKHKPYVKELYSLKGLNLLRDAPHDHLHHHALMYGIRVNGLNFWEETSGCGIQRPAQTAKPELSVGADGLPRATLRQTIHWVAPEDAFLPDASRVALLIEERTLTLAVHESEQEVALRWNSEFTVGNKTNQVTLTGANYHGLGLRFPQELDPLAAHLNAGGKPDLSNNRQDVSAHRWGAVAFDAPGKPATLIVYGNPGNARGDATYFTMRTPFAYLSATQALDREPLSYRTGERFQLSYLIVVAAKLLPAAAIQRRGEAWRAAFNP